MGKEPIFTPTIPIPQNILQTLITTTKTATISTDTNIRILSQEHINNSMESITVSVYTFQKETGLTITFPDATSVLLQVIISTEIV